jgi:hypothetical protein
MACQLYTENDISALYTIVHGEIMDRINDPKLGKFDNKALDKFIKEVYEEYKDEPNGLLYVQAIPDMLDIVKNDLEIKTYLRKDAGLSFDYVQDLSLDFENLDNVVKFVTRPVSKPSSKSIKSSIKSSNKNSKNIGQDNNNNEKGIWSAVQEKAKVDYPDKLTGNIAIAKNPETMSEAERNQKDPQKKLFYDVIKATVWSAKKRNVNDQVMLGDTAVALRAQPIRSLAPDDLTNDDKTFLAKNKTYDINVAIISDTIGNPIRFDENGNVVKQGGRIVYQYIRPVVNRQGKLYLGNRSGYIYNLISAEELAQKQITDETNNGILYGDKERQSLISDIRSKQKQKMNDLARLNEKLANLPSDQQFVMLPINDGSYGIIEHKSQLLSKTDFANDVEMIYIHAAGLEGYSYFLTNKVSAGVSVNGQIYLQRMDITKEIADNIAAVLTTKGLLNGEPMTPQAKLKYYSTFLANTTTNNRINVEIKEVLNEQKLSVVLEDPATKEKTNVDLDKDDAADIISKHLMKTKIINKNDGTQVSYPASMSYMEDFAVDGAIQKGVQFSDYQITKNKDGVDIIREVKKDYFDFIKPFMKVDYTEGDANYFVGINAYLSFTVPADLTTPLSEQIDIDSPINDDLTSDDIDNGTNVSLPSKAITEEDEETGKKFSIEVFQSTLDNEGVMLANAKESDVVFGLGTSFMATGVANNISKSDKYYALKIGSKKDAPKNFKLAENTVNNIVQGLSKISNGVVNIVGTDMALLSKDGYTQKDVDEYVYNILSEVVKQYPITKIVSNGQTGIAEASIKAAKKLGIPVKVRAFKGFALRYPARTKGGFIIKKNSKENFVKRFVSKSSKTYKKAAAKVALPVDESTTVPEKEPVPTKTVEQQKLNDKKINSIPSLDFLEGFEYIPEGGIERKKVASSMMNQLYGNAKTWDEVEKWWDTTPLKFLAKVERQRLALVFNSTAYGKFLSAGSLLSDATNKLRQEGFAARIDLYGDATPITLYHEAWHAFSQLVLTREEKTKLYDTIRTYDKWATKEYIEIEEDLAEDFIEYAVNGTKQKGFIQTIFDKIKKLIDYFFGKTSKKDVSKLYDIPVVKEYFEKLYTGNFTIDTQNAESNIMPGFQRLNSSKNLIQPLKNEAEAFVEISDTESNKIVDIIDSLFARNFRLYNTRYNTTSGATRLLGDVNNRQRMYASVEKQLTALYERQVDIVKGLTLKNATSENPDYITELAEQNKLDTLFKAVANFGDIALSLSKKTNKGVVSFHMRRSRFSILKDEYVDDAEDATVAVFKSTEGNTFSAKELATDDTLMMLSGIYKLQRDENEDYIFETDENGVKAYSIETDEFGLPVLEPLNDMWNRTARTLQGSLDFEEMYERLREGTDNNPEFIQVLEALPNPYQMGPAAYNNSSEFRSETSFWQDFKKPVIPYIQLTINKSVLEKAKKVDGKFIPEKARYESRLSAANLDIYRIINDWTTNFNIADPATNPYIIRPNNSSVNYLNVAQIIKDFSVDNKGKVLDQSKANDLLKSLGIVMDMTSADIRTVVRNPKKSFAGRYNVDFIFDNLRLVHLSAKADDIALNAAAENFKLNPMYYLLNGLPEAIEKAAGGKARDVRTKITGLAELQNRYSDGYSNFSVLTPEKNRVWEQFLDNTITRIVTSINRAETWQQLTMSKADPNGRFQHMRWLNEANNPASEFSVVLNSIFDLNPLSDNYGNKFPGAQLLLENIGGTQIVNRDTNESTGALTATTDVTSKFLQELHTMLQSGVVEFMRHASKQTAMNLRAKKVNTYSGKEQNNLYVDTLAFSPNNTVAGNNQGELEAFNIILGYIAAEGGRIYRFKSNKPYFEKFSSYNRDVIRKDNGQVVKAGEAFTAFDDMLTSETQEKLYAIIDQNIEEATAEMSASGYYNVQDFNLKDIINENVDLRREVKQDIINYFNKQAQQNYNRLQGAKYVDQSLYEMIGKQDLSNDQIEKMFVKAYTYNYFIHNYETTILAYGDAVQYNHDKEEFHKRNAGLGSGGRGFRADFRARAYINSPMFQRLYAEREGYTLNAYNGTLTSAIIREEVIEKSPYYDEYNKLHEKQYTERFIKAGFSKTEAKEKAKELAATVLQDYNNMKVADGQGWINFEAYRMLKVLEDKWSPEQENLYKRIVNNEPITAAEIKEYFPPYKLQYYGNIKTTGLPLTSFHKFSLAPLIPSVHTELTKLGQIHDMMLSQNVDYVLMETGEKVGHIGNGDVITDANGNIDSSVQFTKNVIFAEYLKNQTEVNSKYKNVSIFSTQLRKMVLEGLYEDGDIVSKDPRVKQLAQNYINRVGEYTELLKNQLINEIGFEETEDGEFVPKDKDSVAKLAKMIRDTLTADDVYSDDLIDIIDVTDAGDLRFDLSLHPEAVKIEKLLLSLINKRIIKQKVKGEPLVQKSSAFYDGLFELPIDLDKMNKTARAEAVKKYMGSNFLPTYHVGKNGLTTAMKVAISLQGDYESLLNLEYKGEPISTIDRLNEAIKDDEWLDANDGANRKAITMVGVRIPVQGLNSMEFMEIYHFLPPEAGNIIIPPAEIVAKSGADFDIDKLSIFMNNIDADGNVMQTLFDNAEEFYNALKNPSEYNLTKEEMFAMQKAGLENLLLNNIRSILELPENFVSLTTPNGTYLVKPTADKLAQFVMDYNPLENMSSDTVNLSAPDKRGKQKEVISPTRIFEVGYNLYKHESNVVGKKTLGLGAIENTFNVIFNSLGATMPAVYTHGTEENERISTLGLRHHKVRKNGEDVISISKQYDVDGINKVADIINQLMNGWVDVEKDAWVFFVQGNYEVAPILLYLLKAGVPFKEAVYFVSQPLVREYVKEKRLAESTFAEPLRKLPGTQGPAFKAAGNVIARNFEKYLADNVSRYEVGADMLDKYFTKAGRNFFTEEEMLKLIEDSKDNPKAARSNLSRTMFLHFLTIEQQIQGLTALKMASNPDTSTMTDVGQAIQAETKLEELATESKIDQDLRMSMINDSIISSFFNTKLVRGLSKPLFKFRYDEDIQMYIDAIQSDFKNNAYLKAAFGAKYRDIFPVVFRNDLLSYLFQNAMRKYQLNDQYSSYALSDSIKLTQAAGLTFGAQVVETPEGPTMVYDNVQIEREFFHKDFLEDSDSRNSYMKRGLYPLPVGTFKNTDSNLQEYTRFVIEREYLRHLMPITDVVKTKEFAKELENVKKSRVEANDTFLRRYAYEKILASRALDNVLNPYHLFNNPDTAYGVRLDRIKTEYRTDFVKDYPVLSRMVVDTSFDKTMFNLFVDDKDMNSFKSNLYTKNLRDLADRTVQKVTDREENNRISDFFAKITFIAMMQAGTNKNKYNFLNLTNFEQFIDIMNDETSKFLNLSSDQKYQMLINFKNRFVKANGLDNKNKMRFKNYLTGYDVENVLSNPKKSSKAISSKSIFGFKLSIDKKGKDQGKANLANHFVGYGAPGTSTYQYAIDAAKSGISINYEGRISEFTVAFVSVNGNNKATKEAIYETIENAREILEAGGTVIMDSTEDANRSWNKSGEALVQEAIGEPTGQTSQGYNYWGNNPEMSFEDQISEEDTEIPETIVKRVNLISTVNPNVFVYNDLSETADAYKYIVENNPDITFVYQFSLGQKQAYEQMSPAEFAKKKISGQVLLKRFANSSSIGLIAGQNSLSDAFSKLDAKYYDGIKNIIEDSIAQINDVINDGGKVAFSINGYGDPALMPQELFVYLSRRLFEEFQYLNPGSEFANEVSDQIANLQPITDAEILAKFEGENNPLKC